MMRRAVLFCLLAALLVLPVPGVRAETNPDCLDVKMQFSESALTGPKEITVVIQVTNVGEEPFGPVSLLYPDGRQIGEFGEPVLDPGEKRMWSGSWQVTEEQLEKGRISFDLVYPFRDDQDNMVTKVKRFSKKIRLENPRLSASILLTNFGAGEWLADYPPDGCVQVDCHDFPVDETDGDYMAYDFTITGTAPGRECISLDLVRDGKTVYFIEIEVLVEEDLGVHLKDTQVYSWWDLGIDEE